MPESRILRPVIRRLWPSDAAAVEACFLRLDPETRASRFMGTLGDAAALAYARQALKVDGVVFGGFVDGTCGPWANCARARPRPRPMRWVRGPRPPSRWSVAIAATASDRPCSAGSPKRAAIGA